MPLIQVIAERFEVEQLVGSGGMGEVFRGRDRLTGGVVAVKLLHASSRETEKTLVSIKEERASFFSEREEMLAKVQAGLTKAKSAEIQ